MDNKKIGCIYCGKEDDLSESDIVPDALTNAKIINPNVCHVEHNSKMSDKFESEVIEELAFLTNYLNIKSSKSSHYAKYTAIYVIGEDEYTAKNIVSDEDFIKRTIWTKNKNEKKALGPMEEIRGIAIKRSGNDNDVKEVDLNSTEILKKIEINTSIFSDRKMFRLVAKIAFELYCLQNDITNYYSDFDDIINFIVEDKGNDIVKIVVDKRLLKEFDSICSDGNHCFVIYFADDGSVNALIDMFGIALYNIKICNDIPSMCKYNWTLQKLLIDGSRVSIKCRDFNEVHEKFIEELVSMESKQVKNPNFPDIIFNIQVPDNSNRKDKKQYYLFLMNLVECAKKGFEKSDTTCEKFEKRIRMQINKLMQYSVLSKRLIKRFVEEKNLFRELKQLNPKGTNKKDLFLYYIVYLIGTNELVEYDNNQVINLLNNNLKSNNRYEYKMNKENCEFIKQALLSDKEYSKVIMKGAELIENW